MDTETAANQVQTLLLVNTAETQGMEKWSEDKRREFSTLFNDRSEAARFIFMKTAQIMWDRALERRFVSEFHTSKLDVNFDYASFRRETNDGNYRRFEIPAFIGGRSVSDLDKIAEERAENILAELPPLKTAVRVISKETAVKIDRRDQLVAKLRELKAKLEEMAGSISLADVDQKMTIGDFRRSVKDREKKRRSLVQRMNEMGLEGNELDRQINTALYKGLPGLSDAVVKVVKDHIERASAIDTTARRVTEKVLFGDSSAALELLKGFERDEVTVSDNIRSEFAAAMLKLGVSAGKKAKPRLRGKRS